MTATSTYPFAPTMVEALAGSVHDLYRVYLEVAERDHACRIQALYGQQPPPPGHTPYRPLPLHHFEARLQSACAMPGGERLFRQQLARWAHVYGVATNEMQSLRAA